MTEQAQTPAGPAVKKVPSPYAEWQATENVPIIGGLVVPDLRGELPMSMWARKGVEGAFISLRGGEESMDAYIIDIPPTKNTEPEKYMFEEEYVVLSGRGATTIWLEGGQKQTFEWQAGSVFSPPMNAWRQHFNGSADQPVRLLAISNAPVMFNLFRSDQFIFNCDHAFTDRFSGEEDYFSGKGDALPNLVWRSNFIPDVTSFTLKDYSWRGGGSDSKAVMFEMANNTIQSHCAEFPVGTYKKAHRHGPGAHILVISGTGFSLMWEEGQPMQKLEWGPGTLFAPPHMWFHQHFNAGSEPARYFAVHYGAWRVVVDYFGMADTSTKTGGHQIDYADENDEVMEIFTAELAKNGATPKPLKEWRYDVG